MFRGFRGCRVFRGLGFFQGFRVLRVFMGLGFLGV